MGSTYNRPGSLKRIRGKLFRSQGGLCHWCKKPMHFNVPNLPKGKRVTIDHVLPVSKGGSHHVSNLVAACLNCNQRRGDKG